MTKFFKLTFVLLSCGLLIGCNAKQKKAHDIKFLPDTEELYKSDPYDSTQLRKAKDEAKIKSIQKWSEIEQAELKVLLAAAQNNVQLTNRDPNIKKANHDAVDSLLDRLPAKLPKDSPILIASFVNLDNLNESSTFGRVVSEQVASQIKQRGYTTIEMKLRTTVFIKEGSGEFLLSRELSKISNKHRAQAVVVGTYAAARDRVYLTVRLVNVSDSRVLSSYDYQIPMRADVFKMLLKEKENINWL